MRGIEVALRGRADAKTGSPQFCVRLSSDGGQTWTVGRVSVTLTTSLATYTLGTTTDPKLPAGKVDLILLVDVYHEFDQPFEMTEAMVRALKPGGRLVFVEFRGEDPKVPIKLVHKMTEAQVRKEMGVHPLEWVETAGVLPWQHVIVFRKKP